MGSEGLTLHCRSIHGHHRTQASAKSQLNSVIHTVDAGEQNAVQARISEDLDALKREAFRWQCTSGTSCTGDVQFEDIPMRYNTTHAALTLKIELIKNY